MKKRLVSILIWFIRELILAGEFFISIVFACVLTNLFWQHFVGTVFVEAVHSGAIPATLTGVQTLFAGVFLHFIVKKRGTIYLGWIEKSRRVPISTNLMH